MDYVITPIRETDPIPYHLLLLADENQQLIDAYLPSSAVYLLTLEGQVRGVCLLRTDTDGQAGEIMNLAVEPAYQGKGLGKALLAYAVAVARRQGLHQLVIKTGNSGIPQLALYQRHGFNLIDVRYNYFIEAYPAPIWEHGIQCKHQLSFELIL